MRLINFQVKLVIFLLSILLFWQVSKLRPFYTIAPEIPETKELTDEKPKTEQILVTVYYEALCPDSRNFILKQLEPTFNSIESYIQLQLIPYGKAETIVTNEDYTFDCQHGPVECEANIIHACTINKISNSRIQLGVVACMIRNNMHPQLVLKRCANGLDEYKEILTCSQSIEGRTLLMKYGEATNSLRPEITFIPTITFNNKFEDLVPILKNLLRQICQQFKFPPPECKN